MATTLKIVNSVLILFAVFMGIKQGWAMLSGKTEMLEMFSKWNIAKGGVMVFGAITLLSSVLIMFPKPFLWGNFVMAASILFLMALHLQDKNLKGFAIELPFFFLSLIIIYLQHPLVKTVE